MSHCHTGVARCHRMSRRCHEMSQNVTKCHVVTKCHKMSQNVTKCHKLSTWCLGASRTGQRVDIATDPHSAGGSGGPMLTGHSESSLLAVLLRSCAKPRSRSRHSEFFPETRFICASNHRLTCRACPCVRMGANDEHIVN